MLNLFKPVFFNNSLSSASEKASNIDESNEYGRSLAQIVDELEIGGDRYSVRVNGRNDALTQSTVYACIRILSEAISQCQPEVVIKKKSGKSETSFDHDLLEPLIEPNSWQTGVEFMQTMVSNVEFYGNSFIEQVDIGSSKKLIPFDMERVTIDVQGWDLCLTEHRRNKKFNYEDMLHFKWLRS
jgi:HK97 family phage portal protein